MPSLFLFISHANTSLQADAPDAPQIGMLEFAAMHPPKKEPVNDVVELTTAFPKSLVPHCNPRTKLCDMTSAMYGEVCVWSSGYPALTLALPSAFMAWAAYAP